METTNKNNAQAAPANLEAAMSYDTYLKLVADLLAENKVTGAVQSEALAAYTRLNLHRMHRIQKTMNILPEVKTAVEQISLPQTWVVITEGWCGDAAQTLPVFYLLSQLNTNIDLKIVLRDENLSLMDQYLTNGSRSIPKLIVFDTTSGEEFFNWGPRPAELQEKFYQMRKDGIEFNIIKEDLQRWYAHDRTYSTQKELAALIGKALDKMPL